MESREKAYKIAEYLDNKKAQNVKIYNLAGVSSLCDYFVICSGGSAAQVKAFSDEVYDKLREEATDKEIHIEGYNTAIWILMDYCDVVVHIFQEETREFYDIERLWKDAEQLEFVQKED